ncbi:MAG: YceI family protein [Bradymonadaceae bacterium]
MATYRLNDSNSLLYVLIDNDSGKLLSKMGHDHVVHATNWTGTLDYEPDDPSRTSVRIELPVAGLRADEEEIRKRVGYKGGIPEGDRQKTQENMLKKDQLFAKRFPTITFTSTACDRGDEGTLQVRGRLTVRGKTRPVDLSMTLEQEEGGLRARGRFVATHADFGFKPFSAPFGALKNKEEITFVIDVLAMP